MAVGIADGPSKIRMQKGDHCIMPSNAFVGRSTLWTSKGRLLYNSGACVGLMSNDAIARTIANKLSSKPTFCALCGNARECLTITITRKPETICGPCITQRIVEAQRNEH